MLRCFHPGCHTSSDILTQSDLARNTRCLRQIALHDLKERSLLGMIGDMNKRTRMLLYGAGSVMMLLFLGTLGWVVVNSTDVAAPDVSDLIPDVVRVPDKDNAYVYLAQALAALHWPKDDPDPEFAQEEWDDAFVTDSLARNAEALALLKQGLACPAYQPSGGSALASQESCRWNPIAVLLAQKAAYERRTGQSRAACASACDLLRLGSLVTSHPRSLNEWFSGLMVLELGLEGAEQWLHEAPRDEAELVRLSERLKAVGPLDPGLTEAFQMEFQRIDEAIDECALRRPRRSPLAGYAFHPNRTRATAAQFYRTAIQNAPRPYAQRQLPEVPPLQIGGIHRFLLALEPNKQGRMLGEMFLLERNPMGSCFEWKCGIQSYLDGLRLVIACRLYEMRHGRLPETLDTLVPELLAEVPRDPFDGAPFRYVREDAVVYSVGKDLKDPWLSGTHRFGSFTPGGTEESAPAADWPAYPSPARLLRRAPGDLVYHLILPRERERKDD